MRSAMLNFATKNKPDTTKDKADTQILAPESELKHVLQKIDLSKYVGKKLVELNGYVITVQKQK